MKTLRSQLLSGLFVAIVLFVVSCTLIPAIWTLDNIAFGPTDVPPNPQTIENEAQLASFVQWLSQLGEAHQRWREFYLPLLATIVGAAAGRFSTNWSWTWLVAAFAISPVLVMVVASNSSDLRLGICLAFVYSVLAVSGATFLAWSRRRRGKL